jgi:hypothetical protein
MIAAAIVQTALLLSSGAFNVVLNPGSLSVEKQLFVSSVILMIGFAQGFVLLLFKLFVRSITGWNLRFGTRYLFAPLAKAMSNAVNNRPGETDVDVITPVVTKTVHAKNNPTEGSNTKTYDVFDSDDEDDLHTTASHFMPELEIVLEERRNVYTDIYLLGIATFTVTYCIDTVSPVPTTAFISGLLLMSIAQSSNIIVILARTTEDSLAAADEVVRILRGKRLLTVMSCIFASSSFAMFCVGLASEHEDVTSVRSMFDVTFSLLLPLIAPWLLISVSPKQQPLRTLFECTPFVFTICLSFVLFFLATRGQISTIVHQISSASNRVENSTQISIADQVIDFEFHSDVNASLHFNLDMFTTTSVDSAGNIPMLMLAPFIKIPTIVVVLANVMNRSNLVVITALLVTMTMREITLKDVSTSTHRAYCVALGLAMLSLIFNVVKYLRIPSWAIGKKLSNRSSNQVHTPDVGDIDLELEEYNQ